MRAWLTLDSIPNRAVRAISLPDSELWQAQLLGSLVLLSEVWNWEKDGVLTPEQMSDEWRAVLLDFISGDTPMLPAGSITLWAGQQAPPGAFICTGGEASRTEYPRLFAAIGETYGPGDGNTTFNIPNLQERVAVGVNEDNPNYDTVGIVGGFETVVLTEAQLPVHTVVQNAHTHLQNAHTHLQDAHTHTVDGGINAASGGVVRGLLASGVGSNNTQTRSTTPTNQNTTPTNQNATATNQPIGSGQAHPNMPPHIVLNYVIWY